MNTSESGPRRALVCAPLPPEYDRESGSRRVYHMIELLRAEGWSVAFVCENAPADSRHLRHLQQKGIPAYVGFGGHTPELVEAGRFDVAIFAFWYMADRYADLVRSLSPETRVVVDTVDLHWLRNARRLLSPNDGASGRLDDDFGSDLVAEINAYATADGVLTVSRKEASLVNDLTGDPNLARAVPDYDDLEVGEASFDERRGVLFVGNFRHPPNLDAVEYLCEEVLPLVPPEVLDEHPVSIVGNAPVERVRELAASRAGVKLVGWVPSLIPYLHTARVSVVPLRYGAGTKRKLIQALLAGTPSVATPVGVEGLDLTDGEHVLVADDAPAFAAALERLLRDEPLWSRLSLSGRERMSAAHGREAARSAVLQALHRVVAAPRRSRGGNDTGAVASARTSREAFGRVVEEVVPEHASVLVVSKGDPALVNLPSRAARHFPATPDGRYAGYHPRDSSHAIRQLDQARGDAEYLAFPAVSNWWLSYYSGFARHLASHHERVWAGDECVIYRLGPGNGDARPRTSASAPPRHPAAVDGGPS